MTHISFFSGGKRGETEAEPVDLRCLMSRRTHVSSARVETINTSGWERQTYVCAWPRWQLSLVRDVILVEKAYVLCMRGDFWNISCMQRVHTWGKWKPCDLPSSSSTCVILYCMPPFNAADTSEQSLKQLECFLREGSREHEQGICAKSFFLHVFFSSQLHLLLSRGRSVSPMERARTGSCSQLTQRSVKCSSCTCCMSTGNFICWVRSRLW